MLGLVAVDDCQRRARAILPSPATADGAQRGKGAPRSFGRK